MKNEIFTMKNLNILKIQHNQKTTEISIESDYMNVKKIFKKSNYKKLL